MIQLRQSVVAATDQCENLASVRVDRDQRNLRIRNRCRLLALGCLVLLADDLVHVLHADLDRLRSSSFQVGIERSVDTEILVGKVLVADSLDKLVVHEVDEVGSLARIDVWRRESKRFGFGACGFACRDGVCLNHGVEHDVAALHSALGMAIGIAIAWVLK